MSGLTRRVDSRLRGGREEGVRLRGRESEREGRVKARGRDTRTEGGFPRLRYRHHRRRGGLYPGLSNTRKSAT